MPTLLVFAVMASVVLVAVLARPTRALPITVLLNVASFSVVVVEVLEAPLRGAFFMVMGLSLFVAMWRSRAKVVWPPWIVLAWLGLMGAVMVAVSEQAFQFLLYGATYSYLGLLAIASATVTRHRRWILSRAIAITITIQSIIATREAFFGGQALWPRRDLTTFRLEAFNNFLPELGVRAMGTTGYAITLGAIGAACCVGSIWFAVSLKNRKFWIFAALSIYCVLLSGTRTSLISIAVVLVIWATLRKITPFTIFSALTVVAGGVLISTYNVLSLIGIGAETEETQSFIHRTSVFKSAFGLFDRDIFSVFFGGGQPAVIDAFESNYVHGAAGLLVFDNEYVRTLAAFGLVGFALLIGVVFIGIFRTSKPFSLVIMSVLFSALTYDVVTWYSLFVLLIFLFSVGRITIPRIEVASSFRNFRDNLPVDSLKENSS